MQTTATSSRHNTRSAPELKVAIDAFVADRRIGGCTTATLNCYADQLMQVTRWAVRHDLDLPSMCESDVRDFLATRREVSRATLFNATVRVKTFFKWCGEQGICDDLAARIRKPRQEVKVVETLTLDQVRAMLSMCANNGFVGRRDESLVRFLVDTGARISEALDLTLERVELHAGRALVNGKGSKQRHVFFGKNTRVALESYLHLRRDLGLNGKPLFVNGDGTPVNRRHACQTVTRLARRAGVRAKRCSPHVLRHTCAVTFLRNGGDSLALQRLLGHTTLAMTNRYVASLAIDDVESAHRRASPGETL